MRLFYEMQFYIFYPPFSSHNMRQNVPYDVTSTSASRTVSCLQQAERALRTSERKKTRNKPTDSSRKMFGSIRACLLVPVVLCQKWLTFNLKLTFREV